MLPAGTKGTGLLWGFPPLARFCPLFPAPSQRIGGQATAVAETAPRTARGWERLHLTTDTIPHTNGVATNGDGNGHGHGGTSSGEIFAANVIALRKARGWTPKHLGELFNPDSSSPAATISAIETARQKGLDTVDRMAEVFGKTPAEMITELPCGWCDGEPPAGFTCTECGTSSPRPDVVANA